MGTLDEISMIKLFWRKTRISIYDCMKATPVLLKKKSIWRNQERLKEEYGARNEKNKGKNGMILLIR